MTGLEISEELENKQINPWPKYNPIELNQIKINMWNKWVIKLEYKKGQWKQNVANKPIKYKPYKMSLSFDKLCLRKIELDLLTTK